MNQVRMRIAVLVVCLLFAASILLSWGSLNYFDNAARSGLILFVMSLPFVSREPYAIRRGKEPIESPWYFTLLISAGIFGSAFILPFCSGHRLTNMTFPSFLQYAGFVLVVSGYILRSVAVATLKRQFSYFVTVQENHQLITTGIYSLIRHPVYLGVMTSLTGMALIFPSMIGFLFLLFYFILLTRRMDLEEKLLLKHFGPVYQEYSTKSFRLIPHIY